MPGKFECIGRRRSAWCTRAELSDRADSETPRRPPCRLCITSGWIFHKRTISYYMKDGRGAILREPGHSVRSRGHVHNDLLDQYFGYPSGPPQESHALLCSFRQCPGGTRRFGGGGNPTRVGRLGTLGAGSRSCGAGTNAIHWGVDAMSMDSQPSEACGRHELDGKVRIEYLCEVLLALLWTKYG